MPPVFLNHLVLKIQSAKDHLICIIRPIQKIKSMKQMVPTRVLIGINIIQNVVLDLRILSKEPFLLITLDMLGLQYFKLYHWKDGSI